MHHIAILVLLVLTTQVLPFDYHIPILPISSTPSSSQHYYLNNIQYTYDQDIVRIKLAPPDHPATSYNIYNFEVVELENYTKLESDEGNGMCSVVKILDNSLSSKYLLNYNINQFGEAQQQEKFTSTTHRLENTKHREKRQGAIQQVREDTSKITVYSLTSNQFLHQVVVEDIKLSITTREGDFSGYDRVVTKQVFNCGSNVQQCIEKDIYQLSGRLVLQCLTDQSVTLSYVTVNEGAKLWESSPIDRGNILVGNNKYIETKKLEGNGEDRLYLLTESSVHQIRQVEGKLAISELSVEGANKFIRMSPVYLSKVPYLLLCEKKELLIYNIEAGKVEHRQNFDGLVNMDSIQHISYAFNNIQMDNMQGVVQLVVAEKRRQFVIELFHESSWIGSKLVHVLHVNKIYHNYHANTESYSQDQLSNINTISKILYPSSPNGFSNNLGLLSSKHKIVFFQYGLPRTISPAATAASQFIKEQTYSNIVDLSTLSSAAPHQIDKTYDENWLQAQLARMKQSKIGPKPDASQLIGYVVTLDRYINIIQANPKHLYSYEYVCNLDWRGRPGAGVSKLNAVRIRMESLCEEDASQGETTRKLVYCEKEQIINFHIANQSIQQQRDRTQHILFVCIGLLLIIGIGALAWVMWKKLQKQDERLQALKSERRMKLMQHSKLEHEIGPNKV